MRELRIVTCLALGSALLGFGCDDSNSRVDSGTGTDSGVVLMDSGPPVDSGPVDSGGGTDSGMTGTCGPAAGDCDISNPTSCGTGMACVLQGSTVDGWSTVCIMAGVVAGGAACDPMMQGQCQEGYQCESGSNLCRQICCGNPDCNPGEFCGLIGGAMAGFCRPSDGCDLVAQTGCGATQACYPASGGNVACFDAGDGTEGMPCEFLNGCAAGLGCLGTSGGASACRQFCDRATPACPTGFTCQALTGFDTVGACLPDAPTP